MAKDITFSCLICNSITIYRHFGETRPIKKYCSSLCRVESSKKQIKISCISCNNLFSEFPSVIKAGGGKYCSMNCANNHRRKHLTCKNCNVEFMRYAAEANKSKSHYCSKECGAKHRNHLINCEQCGKEFHVYLSGIQRGTKYCSQSCAGKMNYKDKPCFHNDTPQERFFKGISDQNHPNGCWIWDGLRNKAGYGRIRLKYSDKTCHRYSWELHNGLIPKDKIVCHHCDVTSCVNPSHLYLGTHQDNANDRSNRNRGRDQAGSKHNMAKLTEAQVLQIKEKLINGATANQIMGEYSVSRMTVSNIKLSKSWKHIL